MKRIHRSNEMLMFVEDNGLWVLWCDGSDIKMFESTTLNEDKNEDEVWASLDVLLGLCRANNCNSCQSRCGDARCKCIGVQNLKKIRALKGESLLTRF